MDLPQNQSTAYFLQFHENGQSPYNYDFDRGQMFILDPGYGLQVEIGQQTETQWLRKSDNNCNEENSSKKSDCINSYFSKKLGCTLPWKIEFKETSQSLKKCSGKEKFNEFINLSISILNSDVQKELKDEGCLDFNCIQRTWDIKHFDTRADQTNQTWFWYYVPHHSKVLIRKEVKTYTFTNFFAEVGGYLGLLLGESMVSYLIMSITWLEVIMKKIAARCQGPGERSNVQS